MGFYNIVLEGQQAEEYKARKAREAEEKKKAKAEREERRAKAVSKKADTVVDHDLRNRRSAAFDAKWDATAAERDLNNARASARYSASSGFRDRRNWFATEEDFKARINSEVDDLTRREREKYETAKKDADLKDRSYHRAKDGDISARDAVSKDMRRHPERWIKGRSGKYNRINDNGVFESVEFLND